MNANFLETTNNGEKMKKSKKQKDTIIEKELYVYMALFTAAATYIISIALDKKGSQSGK